MAKGQGMVSSRELAVAGRLADFCGIRAGRLNALDLVRDTSQLDWDSILFLYYLPFSSPIHTTDCRLMLGPELYSTYQILNQNYLVHILYI